MFSPIKTVVPRVRPSENAIQAPIHLDALKIRKDTMKGVQIAGPSQSQAAPETIEEKFPHDRALTPTTKEKLTIKTRYFNEVGLQ